MIVDTAPSNYAKVKSCRFKSSDETKALRNLTKQKDIIIQKADKGNTVVINPQDKIKNIIKSLYDKESLMLYQKISPVGCRPGILYRQAKVHKPVINNCPSFRPILDAINTPSYNFGKFILPILSPLTINEYTVKDSFVFAKEITKTDCKYIVASLDVESLFTNIPLRKTIESCVNDLFFDKSKIDNLTKQDLFNLLSAAAKESFFIFDNSLFCQIDGETIGFPLGPALANVCLCHYEKECQKKLLIK